MLGPREAYNGGQLALIGALAVNDNTAKLWILIYLFLPLVPVSLSAVLRTSVTGDLNWDTVNASEVAITSVFICLLVSQSVARKERLLDSDYERGQAVIWAIVLVVVALFVLATFASVVIYETQVNALGEPDHLRSLRWSQGASYVFLAFVIFLSVQAQKSFGLKAGVS